ncbi:MAG: hypothetical protein KF803_08660 [Cyclobacteriaceae bacterium]|nr:hypothetical protein [Cyclobacteriaceae bacterium]
MKVTSGSTLLIVLKGLNNPQSICSLLSKLILSENVEMKISGDHLAVFVSDYTQEAPTIAGSIAAYLREVCIVEQCSPFDERYLVELLSGLDITHVHRLLIKELRSRIKAHIAHAKTHFKGDLNHHRESNCEVFSGPGVDW